MSVKTIIKLLVIFLLVSLCTVALADITQSHHDFSGSAWANNEICLPCHTPHNASVDVPNSPLWNHQLTTSVFQVYQSSTMESIPGQPGGHSKLCLSCHDGTVALENHSGNTGGVLYISVGLIGTELKDDHPISITYNSALATADGELYDPATTPSGLGGTIAQDLLQDGKVECSTCHDVHVSRNTDGCLGCHFVHGGTTRTLSLRVDNTNSALCFTCHKK